MHWLLPEPTQKYEVSHPRPCRKIDVAETGFNFYALACAGTYSKSMSYAIRPAEKLILAETVFNFYALACAGAYSKV